MMMLPSSSHGSRHSSPVVTSCMMIVNGNFVSGLHDELLCSKCVGGPLQETQQHESSEFEGRKRWSKQRSERSQSLFVRHDCRCVSWVSGEKKKILELDTGLRQDKEGIDCIGGPGGP